jgi:immune inhibitor A
MVASSFFMKLRSTRRTAKPIRRRRRNRGVKLEHLEGRMVLSAASLLPAGNSWEQPTENLYSELSVETLEPTDTLVAGDANADSTFDSHDLVLVMQTGKYETGELATWEEGDWNRDGVFDTSDLLLAQEAGHYTSGDVAANEPRSQVIAQVSADWIGTDQLTDSYRPMALGEAFRSWTPTADRIGGDLPSKFDEAEAAAAEAASEDTSSCIQATKWWLSLDTVNGVYFFSQFHLLAEGDDAQIWVQLDLGWTSEDPRSTPLVTCEQAAYMLAEFQNTILPVETDFFGAADEHDGSAAILPGLVGLPSDYYADSEGRQVVLVSNVRDENYYDSTFPLYIAGFYSDALESFFDRNTMSIDAFDWANRTGPDAARPYLYEGVFAHEYQHLLHSDYDPDETLWVNEGLADFAQFIVGYGHPDSHVSATEALPENSLVVWEDQGPLEILSDYGHAYMFMQELYQSYGPEAIRQLFLNSANDISGVDAALANLGSTDTFADVYHRYAPGLYMTGHFEELPDFQVKVGPPGNPNPEAFATQGAPPWGTDYIWLEGHERAKNLVFNGVQFNPTEWTSDGEALYGGNGNLIDNFMIAEVDLAGVTDATLTFDTRYDIEEGWDFGFVQVSTDGGATWTSLSNGHTTSAHDPQALPEIVNQLPGLTGTSNGWVPMSFDLSAYDGMEVLVAFRHMTDWSINEAGWYVDNIDIAGVFSSDGSSTAGFQSLNEVRGISNEFTVQLVGERNRQGKSEYKTITILAGGVMEDWAPIADLFANYRRVVMLVTYDAPEGVTSYADYRYEIISGGNKAFAKA